MSCHTIGHYVKVCRATKDFIKKADAIAIEEEEQEEIDENNDPN